VSVIAAYLQRHQLAAGEVLFRQGDPANSVEILALGRLVVTGKDEQGRTIRLRGDDSPHDRR
jgi:CRP-like cAMP-binding protein